MPHINNLRPPVPQAYSLCAPFFSIMPGPVYQAGTFSGNPPAMPASLEGSPDEEVGLRFPQTLSKSLRNILTGNTVLV